MTKPRDSQRSKLYHTERYLPNGPIMVDLRDCARLIAACLSWYGPLVRPLMPPELSGRGTSSAWGGARRISLPKWARTPRIIVHETAHCIVSRIYGQGTLPGHGPIFVATYTALYERFVDSGLTHDQILSIWATGNVQIDEGERWSKPAKIEHPTPYQPHKVSSGRGRVPIVEPKPKRLTMMETCAWTEGNEYDSSSWGIDVEHPTSLRTVMYEFHRRLRACGVRASIRSLESRTKGRTRWEITFPMWDWRRVSDVWKDLTTAIAAGEVPGVARKKDQKVGQIPLCQVPPAV